MKLLIKFERLRSAGCIKVFRFSNVLLSRHFAVGKSIHFSGDASPGFRRDRHDGAKNFYARDPPEVPSALPGNSVDKKKRRAAFFISQFSKKLKFVLLLFFLNSLSSSPRFFLNFWKFFLLL